jgi:hypothetical protein
MYAHNRQFNLAEEIGTDLCPTLWGSVRADGGLQGFGGGTSPVNGWSPGILFSK